jgi:endonuclease/exonuclease/phosphatase (EEP) superfamily protein YafD
MNLLGADRWWFGVLNLYLPQVIWAAPGLFLTVSMLIVNRRWIWAPLLCVAWVFGPLMGLCWSPPFSTGRGETTVRVMTCNVKFGSRDISSLRADIDRYRPDLVLLQDATGMMNSPLDDYFREWYVRYYGQFVIASRAPLVDAEVEWLNFPGQVERQACLRCRINVAGTVITFYNVHLHSPREALSEVWADLRRPRFFSYAINHLENNAAARLIQARTLGTLLRRETGAVMVAGDLNAPDTSQVCAILRDVGLKDAFAERGRGYGYTYGHFLLPGPPWLPRFSFIRIDHIMTTSQMQAVRCWTGNADASDHRPVFADLVVKRN